MGVFWSGARASGNYVFARGDSFPLCLLEKGDGVANLVYSSLMEKRTERPLLSRANTGSSLSKDLECFSVGLPTIQIDRHFVVRKSVRGSAVPHLKPPGHEEGGMNTFA